MTSLKSHQPSPSFQPKRSPAFLSTRKVTSFPFTQNVFQPKQSPVFTSTKKDDQLARQPKGSPAFVSTKTMTSLKSHQPSPSFHPTMSPAFLSTRKFSSQNNRQPSLQPKRITSSRVNQKGCRPPFQPKQSPAFVSNRNITSLASTKKASDHMLESDS